MKPNYELITMVEAAKRLGCNRLTLHRAMKSDKYETVTINTLRKYIWDFDEYGGHLRLKESDK